MTPDPYTPAARALLLAAAADVGLDIAPDDLDPSADPLVAAIAAFGRRCAEEAVSEHKAHPLHVVHLFQVGLDGTPTPSPGSAASRALTLADAAVDWAEDTGDCHFCGGFARGAHDEDCPCGLYEDATYQGAT